MIKCKVDRVPCCTIVATLLAVASAGLALAAGPPKIANNPYAGVDWEQARQFKTNLHTHTTESDGRMEPARVIREYRERDYRILAITDHDRCTWPWSKHDADAPHENLLAVAGNELSRHHHTLSLFCDFATRTTEHETVLQEVATADGVAVLCHPAMHWPRGWGRRAPAMQLEVNSALRGITQSDFTVEAWFRTTSPGRNILMGNYCRGTAGHLNLELHTDNRVRVYVSPAGQGETTDLRVAGDEVDINTRDGAWHHLAGVRRGDTVRLYLDGQLVGEKPDTAGSFDSGTDVFFIGRDYRTGSTTFEGELDDVRLWQRALSSSEVTAMYRGAKPGSASGPTRDGQLAEYTFEPPEDTEVEPGDALGCAMPDTAGHPAGAFLALPAPGAAPTFTRLSTSGTKPSPSAPWCLRFSEGAGDGQVPDGVVRSYAMLFERYPHLLGLEVLNGTRRLSEHALDRELWDKLLMRLMPARPVWGFSNDDMHHMKHLGRDWIWVVARRLDEPSVRRAITDGTFFLASTRVHRGEHGSVDRTPRIQRIDHDDNAGTITISATEHGEPFDGAHCQWIADGRHVHTGMTLDYRNTPGITSYVRAELRGQGGLLLTNPLTLSP